MSENIEDDQRFCLRWNSANANLCTRFHQMFIDQRYVDVTLFCDGQLFHCHRLVLSAYSSLFDTLLGCVNSGDQFQPIIILQPEVKIWQIATLLEFMYRGEVEVSRCKLNEILKAANLLQIRGLSGCELYEPKTLEQRNTSVISHTNRIGSEITDSIASEILDISTLYTSLVQKSSHHDNYMSNKATKPLSPEEILTILKNTTASLNNESVPGLEQATSSNEQHRTIYNSIATIGTNPDTISTIDDQNNVTEPSDKFKQQTNLSLSAPPAVFRKRKSPDEMQEAAQRILRGRDFAEVCKELDMNAQSLRKYMKRKKYLPIEHNGKLGRCVWRKLNSL